MKLLDVVFVYHLVDHAKVAWHGRYHAHDEFEIHFFVDGDGTFLCGKTHAKIDPGVILSAAPQDFHSIIPDTAKRPITYYAILFELDNDTNGTDNLLAKMIMQNKELHNSNNSWRMQCQEIAEMFRSENRALVMAAEYLFVSFLFRLFPIDDTSFAEHRQHISREIRRTNHVQVTKALAVMQVNLTSSLSIDEIARIIAMSPEHFIRVFHKELKMTPHQYMLRLKIEGATGLLISTNKTVEEIADWFGFKNQFHFSKIFKKCTSLSPSKYRKIYIQTVDFTTRTAK